MARCANQFDAGDYFAVPFQQPPLAGFFHRNKILRKITSTVAVAGIFRVFELASLYDILRVGEKRQSLTIHDARVPSTMVEVKMSIDYNVDFVGGNAARNESFRKPG